MHILIAIASHVHIDHDGDIVMCLIIYDNIVGGDSVEFFRSPIHMVLRQTGSAVLAWNLTDDSNMIDIISNTKQVTVQARHMVFYKAHSLYHTPTASYFTLAKREKWMPSYFHHVDTRSSPVSTSLIQVCRMKAEGIEPAPALLKVIWDNMTSIRECAEAAADRDDYNDLPIHIPWMDMLRSMTGSRSPIIVPSIDYQCKLPRAHLNDICDDKKGVPKFYQWITPIEMADDVHAHAIEVQASSSDEKVPLQPKQPRPREDGVLPAPVGNQRQHQKPLMATGTWVMPGADPPYIKQEWGDTKKTKYRQYYHSDASEMVRTYCVTHGLGASSFVNKTGGGYNRVDKHKDNQPGVFGPTAALTIIYDQEWHERRLKQSKVTRAWTLVSYHSEPFVAGSMVLQVSYQSRESEHKVAAVVPPIDQHEEADHHDAGAGIPGTESPAAQSSQGTGDHASVASPVASESSSRTSQRRATGPTTVLLTPPTTKKSSRSSSLSVVSPSLSPSPSVNAPQPSDDSGSDDDNDVEFPKVNKSDKNALVGYMTHFLPHQLNEGATPIPHRVLSLHNQHLADASSGMKEIENSTIGNLMINGSDGFLFLKGCQDETQEEAAIQLLVHLTKKLVHDPKPSELLKSRGYIATNPKWKHHYHFRVVYRFTGDQILCNKGQGCQTLSVRNAKELYQLMMNHEWHVHPPTADNARMQLSTQDIGLPISSDEDKRISDWVHNYSKHIMDGGGKVSQQAMLDQWVNSREPKLIEADRTDEVSAFRGWLVRSKKATLVKTPASSSSS
jgi:hypothetical protein